MALTPSYGEQCVEQSVYQAWLEQATKSLNSQKLNKKVNHHISHLHRPWTQFRSLLLLIFSSNLYIYKAGKRLSNELSSFVFHCEFSNQHNRKTKGAFDVMTKGPFDVYPCLFTF